MEVELFWVVLLLFKFFDLKRSCVDVIVGSLYCQIFKFCSCFLGYSGWMEYISVDLWSTESVCLNDCTYSLVAASSVLSKCKYGN